MRMIDADALKDSLRDSFEACQRWADGAKDEEIRTRAEASRDTFLEAILRTNGMPTIDPVVRCKDCKHRPIKPEDYENGFDLEFPDGVCSCQCDDEWYSWYPSDNWFCPKGERKDGDGDG